MKEIRENSSQLISLQDKGIIFLLILLALMTFYPLLSTGFTTNDDTRVALLPHSWGMAVNYAIGSGRINFLVGEPMGIVPYLLDNPVYYNLIRFGTPLILLSILFLFISRLYNSSSLAVVVAVFFLGFIQNSWQHNALTSFLFGFNIYAIAYLLSLACYIYYLKKGGVYGYIAGALYFISLTSELFVLYFVIFVGVTIIHLVEEEHQVKGRDIVFFLAKRLWPIILSLLLYITLYICWRHFFPSDYSGNNAKLGSFSKMVKVIWIYSVSALPGYGPVSNFFSKPFTFGYESPVYDAKTLLAELRVEWLVKGMIVAFLMGKVLIDKSIAALSVRHIKAGLLLASISIFLPNVLLGMTEKYRQWVDAQGSTSYVYTYYSFIAIVISLALLVALLVKLTEKKMYLKMTLIAVIAVIAGGLSVVTDFHNYFVTTDQQLSNLKWKVVDSFMKTDEFLSLQDDAVIYAPTLFSASMRGIMAIHDTYWTDYISIKSGKKITVVREFNAGEIDGGKGVYYLKYYQEPHSANQFLVYAPISKPIAAKTSGKIRESSARIYSYSKNRKATLVGCWVDKTHGPFKVLVNGFPVKQKVPGFFAADLNWSNQPSEFPSVTLTSEKDMELDDFVLSYYLVMPKYFPFMIESGDGFYGWENALGLPDWNWSKGDATLTVSNDNSVPVPAALSLKIRTLRPRKITVTYGTTAASYILLPGKLTDVEMRIVLKPGRSTIRLLTDTPPEYPGNGDLRKLSFLISDLDITLLQNP